MHATPKIIKLFVISDERRTKRQKLDIFCKIFRWRYEIMFNRRHLNDSFLVRFSNQRCVELLLSNSDLLYCWIKASERWNLLKNKFILSIRHIQRTKTNTSFKIFFKMFKEHCTDFVWRCLIYSLFYSRSACIISFFYTCPPSAVCLPIYIYVFCPTRLL